MKKIYIIVITVTFIFVVMLVFFINSLMFPRKYRTQVEISSEGFLVDKNLVYAIIKTESNFNARAVSPSGAVGLMQILPNTAKWIANKLGEDFVESDLIDPQVNVRFGCFYLKYLFDRFGDLDVVICAYNAGEGKVLDWLDENGRIVESLIDYQETKNYLFKVKKYYRYYRKK